MTEQPKASTAIYSLEAEEAALGCVLINPEAYFEIMTHIKPEDFYLHKHRWVWDTFVRLHEQRLPVDLLTVADELERCHQLNEIGGNAFLTHLVNVVPTSLHAGAYAQLIAREAMRRRLLQSAQDIARLALEEGRDTTEVLREAMSVVHAAALSGRALEETAISMAEAASRTYDLMSDPAAIKAQLLRTGLGALDRVLNGGLWPATLTVLMARPSMGKSSALSQIANSVASAGKVVAIFPKEESTLQWTKRAILQRARVSQERWLNEALSDAETDRWVHEAIAIGEQRVIIDDSVPQTTEQLWAQCVKAADDLGGLDLVIVDHLRLMADEDDNETHRLGKISWQLKQLAKSLNTRVLCAAQLSRSVEGQQDKRPDLRDLRDSGEIEENADVVIGLYREGYYSNDAADRMAEFWIRKDRNGARNDMAELIWAGEQCRFEPVAPVPITPARATTHMGR